MVSGGGGGGGRKEVVESIVNVESETKREGGSPSDQLTAKMDSDQLFHIRNLFNQGKRIHPLFPIQLESS